MNISFSGQSCHSLQELKNNYQFLSISINTCYKLIDETFEMGGLNRCAIHARVSSHKQKKRGDLNSQINALKIICKREGLKVSKVYTDLGSGLNSNRKALWRLIRDAKKGVFNIVVVNFKDRLTRFGFRYLEEYLNEFNVKIKVVNKLENKALETELVEDLVSIIQSFSGRLYGLRSHENKKIALKS